MTIMEGVSADDCEQLRDGVADIKAEIEEVDDPDRLGELRSARTRTAGLLVSACGVGYYPEEDGDELTDSTVVETHSTVDSIGEDIADSMADAVVEDDIGGDEFLTEENKKQQAVRSAGRAKDSLEKLTDEKLERTDPTPKGATTIACKHPDKEKRLDCIERRTEQYDDVRWTGVTKTGETI